MSQHDRYHQLIPLVSLQDPDLVPVAQASKTLLKDIKEKKYYIQEQNDTLQYEKILHLHG